MNFSLFQKQTPKLFFPPFKSFGVQCVHQINAQKTPIVRSVRKSKDFSFFQNSFSSRKNDRKTTMYPNNSCVSKILPFVPASLQTEQSKKNILHCFDIFPGQMSDNSIVTWLLT